MSDMKPVPGQGLKLSLNASRIKAAAQRTQSTPGGAQPRKKQGYKPRPGKPLWMLHTDLTEAIIKNKEFGQIFGRRAFGRLQGFCRKTGGFEHDPHESARKRVWYRHGMVRRYYHDRNKRKVISTGLGLTRSEDRIDWVPALAEAKLVGFVQTLLNRPYTKRDLKKADHTYSPQEEGEDRGEDDQK